MSEILGLSVRALDRARTSRDPRFDGKFFIAVTSTGIYCRPVCPVRSPNKSNIRYYATASAAAEAGYRPCLRCRPEAAPGTPAWLGTSTIVRRALCLIDEGMLDERSVEELSERLGIGPRHLHRLFLQHVGASPITIAQTRRLHFAKRLLDETNLAITDIAMAAGFGSLRRFNDVFQRTYQRSPRQLRKALGGRAAEGSGEIVLRLAYRPPYDWVQVQGFLASRAIPGIEAVLPREYARTVPTEEGAAIVRIKPVENSNAFELRVHGAKPKGLFHLARTVRRVFDLGADPGQIARAFRADPLLASIHQQHPGLRIPGSWEPFECAVRAVLGQQISVPAARTMAARLVAQTGKSLPRTTEGLTHLFPTPRALTEASLNGIGLTEARKSTLKALAKAVLRGDVDFSAPAEEFVRAMLRVPGVGPWTAQYVALRGLGEPDAFPAGDLVLRRIVGSPSVRDLEQRAEAWRPWRGYAAQHLWQSAKDHNDVG